MEVLWFQMFFFVANPNQRALGILSIPGGILIKTGFALVLYSRLYLIVPSNSRILLRCLLAMIIVAGIMNHVPNTVAYLIGMYGPSGMGYKVYHVTMYFDL
jgi:hypothetical protein